MSAFLARLLASRFLAPALLLAALGAALGWLKAHDAAVAATAHADAVFAQYEQQRSAQDSVNAFRAAKERADSLRDAGEAARLASVTRQLVAERAARVSAVALLDSLEATPPTTFADSSALLGAALSASKALRAEAGACFEAQGSLERLLESCQARKARADSSLHDATALLRATDSLLATERRRGRPNVFGRTRQGLPWAAVGFLAGFVLKGAL